MADTLPDIDLPFLDAMVLHQHEACTLQMLLIDVVLLVGVLQERLRHRSQHDPVRHSLARTLVACLSQLDVRDPVIGQWLSSHTRFCTRKNQP